MDFDLSKLWPAVPSIIMVCQGIWLLLKAVDPPIDPKERVWTVSIDDGPQTTISFLGFYKKWGKESVLRSGILSVRAYRFLMTVVGLALIFIAILVLLHRFDIHLFTTSDPGAF